MSKKKPKPIPKPVFDPATGLWRSSGQQPVGKGRRQLTTQPVVADERQRSKNIERLTVHASTLSAPFGSSVRRINNMGTIYTGGRRGNPTARPKRRRKIKPRGQPRRTIVSKREPIQTELRWQILNRDKFTCRYCGSIHGPFHIDHVIPVARGGATTYENLVAACQQCNLRKGSQIWTPNPLPE